MQYSNARVASDTRCPQSIHGLSASCAACVERNPVGECMLQGVDGFGRLHKATNVRAQPDPRCIRAFHFIRNPETLKGADNVCSSCTCILYRTVNTRNKAIKEYFDDVDKCMMSATGIL